MSFCPIKSFLPGKAVVAVLALCSVMAPEAQLLGNIGGVSALRMHGSKDIRAEAVERFESHLDSKTLSDFFPRHFPALGTGSRKGSAYQGGGNFLPGNDSQIDTTHSEENTISSTVAHTKNRIWGIDDASRMLITNGKPEQLEHIKNADAIGQVIQDGTLQELYQITPLIMVINQNARNVQEKVNALLKAGANPDREIVYKNGLKTTPRELVRKHHRKINFHYYDVIIPRITRALARWSAKMRSM